MTVTPLDAPTLDAYLERIDYDGPRERSEETLHALHRAHLYAVPFENLDITVVKRPIVLDLVAIAHKIIGEERGGFCFEQNGLFAAALAGLGFDVSMLSARVSISEEALTPPFDHMTLAVALGRQWLADVGFGDSCLDPVPLSDGAEVDDGRARYRMMRAGEGWALHKHLDGRWQRTFVADPAPHDLADFVARCETCSRRRTRSSSSARSARSRPPRGD